MPKRTAAAARRTARAAAKAAPAEENQPEDVLSAISSALEKGQKKKVTALVDRALNEGVSASDILNNGLVAGMTALGEDFSSGKAFVPEMLMAAKCMNEAMLTLKPLLAGDGVKAVGKAVMGTVKGDLHDIGKNIVKIMLEGSGIEVIDLGVDSSAEEFIKATVENNCDIIACSSLLTTSMNEMGRVVELAKAAGIREKVKILIGGAPASEEFCAKIGADYYTPDAAACARLACELLS